MSSSGISLSIHETALWIEGQSGVPGDVAPAALDSLFRDLREGGGADPETTEARIWQIWCTHQDPDAAGAMGRAIKAMNGGGLEEAERILDRLVDGVPQWAEAWNKRATLRYVLGRDAGSVSDIQRTLELEPRHFGALCGFAQIAVRHGDVHAARVALERALVVHPGLSGARSAIDQLGLGPAEELN